MSKIQTLLASTAIVLTGLATGCASSGMAGDGDSRMGVSQSDLHTDSTQALNALYSSDAGAKSLSGKSSAILVFPKIVKGGLGIGGAYGEGELRRGNTVLGRYNSVTGSWGLQAGAQSYGYAVFLMNEEAVDYLDKTDGWEIGVGPTVVIVNSGAAENISTSTEKGDAFAYIFDQQGLMAGVSIEGTKITEIKN